VDVRVVVLDDVAGPGDDRGVGLADVGEDAEVGAPAVLVGGDPDVAALGVEEPEMRVGGQELLALVGGVGAVAAAGDRRTDELRADRAGVRVGVVALEFDGVVLVRATAG
jgi:hypothetical protein